MGDLFLKLLNMCINASWLVLAVVVLRLLLKKAPKWINCLLWGLVALRLVMPFSLESILSLIPSTEPIPQDIAISQTPTINTGIPIINNSVNPIITETFTPQIGASVNPLQIVIYIASIIWVIGVAAMLIYGILSYALLYKKVRVSLLFRDNIYYCDNIDSPFILGIIKPKIYMPSGISEQQINYVIQHENAHLKRRDHFWKPLGFLLLTVYWFNPCLWVAYILLCRDIEKACDEKVIKNMDISDIKGYSAALLSCGANRKMIMACPVAFGEVGVKERINSILNYKKPAFWVVIVALVTSIAVAVCFLTNPKKNADLSFLPLEFTFSSGAGAWHTTLTVNPDGSFTGIYNDSDAAIGEDYPNGTKFICEFSGKFKDITKINDYTYSLTLKKLQAKHEEGEEWIEDGIKYIASSPYGIQGGDEFLLYTPQTPVSELSEEFLSWYNSDQKLKEKLSCYAILNIATNEGFFTESVVDESATAAQNSYYGLINGLYTQNREFNYAFKDIDGNGTEELLVKSNTLITIYTYEDEIKQIGSHDFLTGSLRMFSSESKEYPGIFYFTVGGSCEHYSYLTIENNEIATKKLAEDHYADEELGYPKRTWVNISKDAEIIKEAKYLYDNNKDIEFLKFEPSTVSNNNSVRFENDSVEYTAINAYNQFLSGNISAKNLSDKKNYEDLFYISDLENLNLERGIDRYTFYDLNGDNIPEMITDAYCLQVFAYKDGEVVMIYETPAAQSSNTSILKNGKIHWSLTTTGTTYIFASIDRDLNVTVDEYFDGKTPQEGDQEIYYYNNKEITESEFYKYKAEFFSPYYFAEAEVEWIEYQS